MAVRVAARWRPQAYRSTTETIRDASGRIEVLQLVVFDDTQIGGGNPYVPGAPATEQYIRIVDEAVIQQADAPFVGKTYQQSRDVWNAARDAQIAVWQADPEIQAKINSAVGAAISSYVILS